jgi:hypothetical protein
MTHSADYGLPDFGCPECRVAGGHYPTCPRLNEDERVTCEGCGESFDHCVCVTPPEVRCTCGAGDHRPPGAHNIHCDDPDAAATE